VNWQPTEKLQFTLDGWRNLQAYVTTQSDYYVSKGAKIAPIWIPSEKISVNAVASFEDQDYIGIGANEISQGTRRDKLTSFGTTVKYTPFKFVVFDFGYAHERHDSNEPRFAFTDNVLSLRVTVKEGGRTN
jgi:hypothetical protein